MELDTGNRAPLNLTGKLFMGMICMLGKLVGVGVVYKDEHHLRTAARKRQVHVSLRISELFIVNHDRL